ncbi:MAG: 6-carboxytetrahydropterin synthase [Planctomycetota bacterium]
MLDLTRTVRFCLTPEPADDDTPRSNTYSAWPAPRGLPRYYELHVTCRGEADPRTGYFINIKHIDTAVREHALPLLRAAVTDEAAAAATPMGKLMRRLFAALNPALDHAVTRLGLQLTPRIELALTPAPGSDPAPGNDPTMDRVQLSQEYEFSAAHRLHVSEYTDAKNRETFGKCNNPAGHGHNYRVRVVVDAPIDPAGHTLAVADLDAAVDRHVIEHLDHKHLNHDVPAFADRNPSVEHIAQVVWGMLVEALPLELPGVTLAEVSVWETGKTVCTYRGPTPTPV